MPDLPSGLRLAVNREYIMKPTRNWFKAPENHFWYWWPDDLPPFEKDQGLIRSALKAPIPQSREEMAHYIQVIIIAEDNTYHWAGDTLSEDLKYTPLDQQDQEVWCDWVNSDPVKEFLDDSIEECRKQWEVMQHAKGFATIRNAEKTDEGRWRGDLHTDDEGMPD